MSDTVQPAAQPVVALADERIYVRSTLYPTQLISLRASEFRVTDVGALVLTNAFGATVMVISPGNWYSATRGAPVRIEQLGL